VAGTVTAPKSPRCALYDVKTIMVYVGGDTSSSLDNGRQYIILLQRRRRVIVGTGMRSKIRFGVHRCIADDGYKCSELQRRSYLIKIWLRAIYELIQYTAAVDLTKTHESQTPRVRVRTIIKSNELRPNHLRPKCVYI